MRRFFVGVALFTLAAVTPLAAWGGDREIAEQIITKLKGHQAAGVLQGFTLDLDVSEGRVLLKGRVSTEAQREAVLSAADGVEGVTKVVDQLAVGAATSGPATSGPATSEPAAELPTPVRIDQASGEVERTQTSDGGFSLSAALAAEAPSAPASFVQPAGATEQAQPAGDAEIKAAVVRVLSAAQRSGELRGFGLEVSSVDGDVLLKGRARTSEQKQTIMEMVRRVPGVRNVIDDIVTHSEPTFEPPAPAKQVRHLQPVEVQKVAGRIPNAVDGPVAPAAPMPLQNGADAAAAQGQYTPTGYPAAGHAVAGYAHGAYVPGTPVPAAPIPVGYGAPHYDAPNLPNYAWPGYAAYPNYAALTYPQQYSPTAWPYIGPFYPYPQVPLGWRKVSLEWDDGWWFLDFTDR